MRKFARFCIECPKSTQLRVIRSFSFNADETYRRLKSPYTHGKHRSDAQELIAKVPVIEVDGLEAVCDGGGGILGHPIEYIQLNTVLKEPAVCKYCGLRYKAKHYH